MALLRVEPLPDDALAASACFHAEFLPRIRDALGKGDDMVLVFAPADHGHRAWRLAAVQQLARESAPLRVNALAADDEAAIAAAAGYLASADGVTGQLLALDGNGAGDVLSRAG